MDPKTLVSDLAARGWTQKSIGDQIGVSQPTIAAILKGHSNIRLEAGERLKKLHRRVMRRKLKVG